MKPGIESEFFLTKPEQNLFFWVKKGFQRWLSNRPDEAPMNDVQLNAWTLQTILSRKGDPDGMNYLIRCWVKQEWGVKIGEHDVFDDEGMSLPQASEDKLVKNFSFKKFKGVACYEDSQIKRTN